MQFILDKDSDQCICFLTLCFSLSFLTKFLSNKVSDQKILVTYMHLFAPYLKDLEKHVCVRAYSRIRVYKQHLR